MQNQQAKLGTIAIDAKGETMTTDVDYRKLAEAMGVPEEGIPEEETEQPDDVAEIEVIDYGDR